MAEIDKKIIEQKKFLFELRSAENAIAFRGKYITLNQLNRILKFGQIFDPSTPMFGAIDDKKFITRGEFNRIVALLNQLENFDNQTLDITEVIGSS